MTKRGRKGKYEEWLTEENLLRLEGWARDGLTDEQICEKMGIGKTAFYDWKNKYPKFAEALKKGKEVVDRQVENALLKRALGYTYTEETVTNKGEVVTVEKYEPPNTTAIIFWLKNRKPADWRDKIVNEHEGKVEHEVVVEWSGPMMDDEEGENAVE
jgi:hypothetical protein